MAGGSPGVTAALRCWVAFCVIKNNGLLADPRTRNAEPQFGHSHSVFSSIASICIWFLHEGQAMGTIDRPPQLRINSPVFLLTATNAGKWIELSSSVASPGVFLEQHKALA